MDGFKKTKILRDYCDYVDGHLCNIATSWTLLQEKCKSMSFIYDDHQYHNIDKLIKEHDLSKLSDEEFVAYAEWFCGPHGQVYDPAIHGDAGGEWDIRNRKKAAFDLAWGHHQMHNPHHWQNWTKLKDMADPKENEWHCVCMVVDWMAMAIDFGDTAEEFYEKNKDKINIPMWARNFLRLIFDCLREER